MLLWKIATASRKKIYSFLHNKFNVCILAALIKTHKELQNIYLPAKGILFYTNTSHPTKHQTQSCKVKTTNNNSNNKHKPLKISDRSSSFSYWNY